MVAFNNFILSTTPTLEGYKINKYFGTVTSHIVTGTGLFSDFAAGMSDIFGGRSESYQKQLISIKEEVLKRLKDEATVLGANGVVGLRVDFDEISGKGKTMFMVTAIGTAVYLENTNKNKDDMTNNYNSNQITSEKLNIEIRKRELVEYLNVNSSVSLEDWEYIKENSIIEVFDPLIKIMNKQSKSWNASDETYYIFYDDYIRALPDDFLLENIYKLFFADHNKLRELAFSLIQERELLNLQRIKTALSLDKLMAKKFALKTLYNCDKRMYSKEDVAEFEEVKNIIKNNFPELGEKVSKKKLMSSDQKETWICPHCKKENSEEEKFCKKCGCDIRGFYEKDIFPEDVITDINSKLEVLTKILNQ